MTTFNQAEIIRAGDSSASPARDFIVHAGDSTTGTRDFIVRYVRFILVGLPLALGVSSGSVTAWSQATSTSSVTSNQAQLLFALRRLIFLNALFQLSSSNANIAPVNIIPGAIQVKSGTVEFFNQQATSLSVLSNLWQVFQVNLGTGHIQVSSANPVPRTLETGTVSISPTEVDLKYLLRIWTILAHTLIVSGSINQWPKVSSVIQISSSTTDFVYKDRIASLQPGYVYLTSRLLNIIPRNLASLPLGVSSTQTTLRYIRDMGLKQSLIRVSSSLTNIKDMKLKADTGIIEVSSSFADLRLLPSGVLPAEVPTNSSFDGAAYSITKTSAMAGRVVRRLMASKPTDPVLTLTYENVSDQQAELVLASYDQSYGTFYGFDLPSAVTQGASTNLRTYLQLTGSSLKWHYAERPVVRSQSKGLSSVEISLKGRVMTR